MNKYCLATAALFLFLINCGGGSDEGPDVIYQYSTITEIKEGKFDGNIDLKGLKKHGDIGLGTYNGLDGEMVYIDGTFYQIDKEGNASIPDSNTQTPFAVIAEFIPDSSISVDTFLTCKNLKNLISRNLKTKNNFHVLKVSGSFNSVTTRSVDKQSAPYPTLSEALENAKVTNFKNIKGDLVGFWFPSYYSNINAPNFHFHFISKDRKKGGHVLSCKINSAIIDIDSKGELNIVAN